MSMGCRTVNLFQIDAEMSIKFVFINELDSKYKSLLFILLKCEVCPGLKFIQYPFCCRFFRYELLGTASDEYFPLLFKVVID
jgi:hypothetical protein